jgi:hypothetical protein
LQRLCPVNGLHYASHGACEPLLLLHGVGPKAIRLLREALAERDG